MDQQKPSYFTRIDTGSFLPTELAGGTWHDDDLHLAPVAGLVIDYLERWRLAHAPELAFSRFSLEVLGQIARERIRELRNALTPWGDQVSVFAFQPKYTLPRLDRACWTKKGEWVTKTCGVLDWPAAGVATAQR